MAKLLVILCLLFAFACANPFKYDVKIEVLSSEEMQVFLQKYPDAVEMKREFYNDNDAEITKDSPTPRLVLKGYIAGAHTPGERLVGYDYSSMTFTQKKDIEMRVHYPAVGEDGAIVTFVNIKVRQDDENGRAWLYDGGIGKRFIKILVEADQTRYFEAETWVYGID